jgi:hypothetical protein
MTFPDTLVIPPNVRYVPEQDPVIEPPVPTLWRVLHDVETAAGNWRPGKPEVHRLMPDHHVVLTEEIQWLWRSMNPHMTDVKFCKMFGNKLAFTNGSGFPGHANYILGEELEKPDPRFDQARTCGGALKIGQMVGDYLYLETIDTRRPIPSAEYVLARRWLFFDAVLSGDVIRMFPQGDGLPVFVPLLTATDGVKLPMWKLQKWTGPGLPSPYQIYT